MELTLEEKIERAKQDFENVYKSGQYSIERELAPIKEKLQKINEGGIQ